MQLTNALLILGALGQNPSDDKQLQECTKLANEAERRVYEIADEIRELTCTYAEKFFIPIDRGEDKKSNRKRLAEKLGVKEKDISNIEGEGNGLGNTVYVSFIEGLDKMGVDYCLSEDGFAIIRDVEVLKPDHQDCVLTCDRRAASSCKGEGYTTECEKPIFDDCLVRCEWDNCEGIPAPLCVARNLIMANHAPSYGPFKYDVDDNWFPDQNPLGFNNIPECNVAIERRLGEIERLTQLKDELSSQITSQTGAVDPSLGKSKILSKAKPSWFGKFLTKSKSLIQQIQMFIYRNRLKESK